MVVGEAGDHVESKDPYSVNSAANAAAWSSPGNLDVLIQTNHEQGRSPFAPASTTERIAILE